MLFSPEKIEMRYKMAAHGAITIVAYLISKVPDSRRMTGRRTTAARYNSGQPERESQS